MKNSWYSSSKKAMLNDSRKMNEKELAKFYNKNGTLTSYALACGYEETYLHDSEAFISLSMEYSHYQIHYLKTKNGLWEWETYDDLTSARLRIAFLKKSLSN